MKKWPAPASRTSLKLVKSVNHQKNEGHEEGQIRGGTNPRLAQEGRGRPADQGAVQATVDLHEKIVEIAHARRRFGHRRIHELLRPQFPGVNHKRVYRLYRHAILAVRRRKKASARSMNVYRCNWTST